MTMRLHVSTDRDTVREREEKNCFRQLPVTRIQCYTIFRLTPDVGVGVVWDVRAFSAACMFFVCRRLNFFFTHQGVKTNTFKG